MPYIQVSIKFASATDTKIAPFVPTFKEINQEICKLSREEVYQHREEFDAYLQKGCKFLIHETLEEIIESKLIRKKKEEKEEKAAQNLLKSKPCKLKLIQTTKSPKKVDNTETLAHKLLLQKLNNNNNNNK